MTNNDYLAHYGVKGMKWGVRRSSRQNPNYSETQRKQDVTLYGRGGERRINRSMNKGYNLKSARSKEVYRRDKAVERARAASFYGGAAASLAGTYALYRIQQNPNAVARGGYKKVAKYVMMASSKLPENSQRKVLNTIANPKVAKTIGYSAIAGAGLAATTAGGVVRNVTKKATIDAHGYRNASTTRKFRG